MNLINVKSQKVKKQVSLQWVVLIQSNNNGMRDCCKATSLEVDSQNGTVAVLICTN